MGSHLIDYEMPRPFEPFGVPPEENIVAKYMAQTDSFFGYYFPIILTDDHIFFKYYTFLGLIDHNAKLKYNEIMAVMFDTEPKDFCDLSIFDESGKQYRFGGIHYMYVTKEGYLRRKENKSYSDKKKCTNDLRKQISEKVIDAKDMYEPVLLYDYERILKTFDSDCRSNINYTNPISNKLTTYASFGRVVKRKNIGVFRSRADRYRGDERDDSEFMKLLKRGKI